MLGKFLRSVIKAAVVGWHSAGITWREEFTKKGVNPDKFLELPNSNLLLAQYLELKEQDRVIFLNQIYRKYDWMRFNFPS